MKKGPDVPNKAIPSKGHLIVQGTTMLRYGVCVFQMRRTGVRMEYVLRIEDDDDDDDVRQWTGADPAHG